VEDQLYELGGAHGAAGHWPADRTVVMIR
jgi:hypothetical protein